MDTLSIVIWYKGKWSRGKTTESYVGGELDGVVVSRSVTYAELVEKVHRLYETDNINYEVELKARIDLSNGKLVKYMKIKDDANVAYILQHISELKLGGQVTPLIATVTARTDFGTSVRQVGEGSENVGLHYNARGKSFVEENQVQNKEDGTTPTNTNGERWGYCAPVECDVSLGKTNGLKCGIPSPGIGDAKVASISYRESIVPANCELQAARANESPKFYVGQAYETKGELLTKLQMAAIRGQFEYTTQYSNTKRLGVSCKAVPCLWRVRAINVGDSEFMITKFGGAHTCDLKILNDKHKQATARLIGESVKRKYMDCRTIYTPLDIIKDTKQNLGVTINYTKAWRAREHALNAVRGSWEDSYALLPSFFYELERLNPGTKTALKTDEKNHFQYCFMALGASIRGFKDAMRPVLAVDATHLKGKYKGVMFTASAFDGNRGIFPLAFGIGDLETDDSWRWFFRELHGAIRDCPDLVVISDRNLSIENVFKTVFPSAVHGICFYHLQSNFKTHFKLKKKHKLVRQIRKAAKAYSEPEFQKKFAMFEEKPDMAAYLREAGFHKWSRTHCTARRFNVMTTNIAESVNSVFRFARFLPVEQILEDIVILLQKWFCKRRVLATKCVSTLCPKFGERKLSKRVEAASRMEVQQIDGIRFTVKDGELGGTVNMQLRTCTCRKFQLELLPCKHAVAVARILGLNLYTLSHPCYSRATWLQAYSHPICSAPPPAGWSVPTEVSNREVLPPISKVMPGRRKNQRIPSQGEGKIKKHCSRCGSSRHNRARCKGAIPLSYYSSSQRHRRD